MAIYLIFGGFMIVIFVTILFLQITGILIQHYIELGWVQNNNVNTFFNKNLVIFNAIAGFCNERPEILPKNGESKRKIKFTVNHLMLIITILAAVGAYAIMMLPPRLLKLGNDVYISDYVIFVICVSNLIELILFYFRFRKFVFDSRPSENSSIPG